MTKPSLQVQRADPGDLYQGRYCLIRPLEPRHATLLHLWLQDPVFAWTHPSLTFHCPNSAMIQERLMLHAQITPPLEYNCLVLAPRTNMPLGVTGLTAFDRVNLKAEYHIGFMERSAKRAIAEALAWGLTMAFEHLGLRKLIFLSAAHNSPMRSFLERQHIPCEGIMRQEIRAADGTWTDLYRYALFADDWRVSDIRRRLQYLLTPEFRKGLSNE